MPAGDVARAGTSAGWFSSGPSPRVDGLRLLRNDLSVRVACSSICSRAHGVEKPWGMFVRAGCRGDLHKRPLGPPSACRSPFIAPRGDRNGSMRSASQLVRLGVTRRSLLGMGDDGGRARHAGRPRAAARVPPRDAGQSPAGRSRRLAAIAAAPSLCPDHRRRPFPLALDGPPRGSPSF